MALIRLRNCHAAFSGCVALIESDAQTLALQ